MTHVFGPLRFLVRPRGSPPALPVLATVLLGLAVVAASPAGAQGVPDTGGAPIPGWSGRGGSQDGQTGAEACESALRRCILACPAGDTTGPCATACYATRAQCIMNPSRTSQPR